MVFWRNLDSTTYVATTEQVDGFSAKLLGEAQRRNLGQAEDVVFISDGAAWLKRISKECFPGTTWILDFYHTTEYLNPMLTDYAGLVQSDGYVGYTAWLNNPDHAKEKTAIVHAACWAHARRKFVKAPDNSTARKIVKLIAKLYRTETELRKNPERERAAYRQEHATPVSRSKISLRVNSPDAGQTSAVIYSLIETCRKLSINPADYLRELFAALPTMEQGEAANWTPAR